MNENPNQRDGSSKLSRKRFEDNSPKTKATDIEETNREKYEYQMRSVHPN